MMGAGVGRQRTLQIVWHSMTGACCQLANAAADGARAEARSEDIEGEGAQAGIHSPRGVGSGHLRKDDAGPPARTDDDDATAGAAGNGSLADHAPPSAGAASSAGRDAGAADVIIRCEHADRVTTEQMLAAGAYLFVAPENLASMAGVMKAFFDRQYYPLLGRIEGRTAAVVVAAGSDGHGAVRQIERILTGWRLRLAADSLIVRVQASTPEEILAPKQLTPEQLAPARELGSALAAGLALGIF